MDSFQYILIWIQIRNIPVNRYSIPAITVFGEIIRQVMEVAYDPLVAQTMDVVRVKVFFNVANPLRISKVVNIRGGTSFTLLFDYERIQKRCYTCQRLTHAPEECPIFLKDKQEDDSDRSFSRSREKVRTTLVLKEDDPLYGILKEDQVGINPNTGRPRMAADVIEGMRQYLMVANGDEKKIREEKVKRSIKEVEMDLIAQRTILRLEPAPIVSMDMDKGKGLIFGYESAGSVNISEQSEEKEQKLLSAAINSGKAMSRSPKLDHCQSESRRSAHVGLTKLFHCDPTVFRVGLYEASPSGMKHKKGRLRKRP